jgi:hypothetical protein
MKRTATLAVIATIAIATVALFMLQRSAEQYSGLPLTERIEYYKLYVELSKAVLVGFAAALLGILIPEMRHSFERFRDSRTAYSEAKTSVDYLPLRLCTLDLKSAGALVQRAHVRKHEAELYDELKSHLKRRGIDLTPDQWGDAIYNSLFDVRVLLERHAADWDRLGPDARLTLLREVVPAPRREALVPGTPRSGHAYPHFRR